MAKMLHSWYFPQYSKENKGITPIDKCIYYSELLDKCKIENHNKIQQNKNCTFYIERLEALKCNKSKGADVNVNGYTNVKKNINHKEELFE